MSGVERGDLALERGWVRGRRLPVAEVEREENNEEAFGCSGFGRCGYGCGRYFGWEWTVFETGFHGFRRAFVCTH